jgi:2-polyprenyl-3-methyl-5-hydroxy-6-metoxy-1,4-benzoquinol methylase
MAQRLRSARNTTLRALDRMSLLAPVYRAYERVRSLRGSEDGEVDARGLPVPPPRLRVEVAGTAGLQWFLDSGRQQAGIIRSAAERNGAPLESAGSLLDFGCGCGRVLRHWAGLQGPAIHGSDYNERLVGWCAANLPFVTASVNELAPPLRYEDGQFDLVRTRLAPGLELLEHTPEGGTVGGREQDLVVFRKPVPGTAARS